MSFIRCESQGLPWAVSTSTFRKEPDMKLLLGIFLICFLGATGTEYAQNKTKTRAVSQDLFKKRELMRSRGAAGSITVIPLMLAGRPFERLSEVVGLLLEQQGLKNIELGHIQFAPAGKLDMNTLADSFGEFVRRNPITTEYALYAEYNGSRETGLVELRTAVVNASGEVMWTDLQGPDDEAMKLLECKEPLTFSVLLVQRLSPELGLSEQTAKAAKPGKMARLMEERSGLPPENERSLMPERQRLFKESRQKVKLAVFPVLIGDSVITGNARELADMINSAGLCASVPVVESPVFTISHSEPNELKVLWDLAREFKKYNKKHPVGADYALYADYGYNPDQWEQGFVHFVVCDRNGEWVIVDLQNSHHPGYQSVKPRSRADCNRLLVQNLQGYLQ